MNYEPNVQAVYASYENHAWLKENWESEKQLLEEFVEIVGVPATITFPEDASAGIKIHFERPLSLDNPPSDSSESSEDGDQATHE